MARLVGVGTSGRVPFVVVTASAAGFLLVKFAPSGEMTIVVHSFTAARAPVAVAAPRVVRKFVAALLLIPLVKWGLPTRETPVVNRCRRVAVGKVAGRKCVAWWTAGVRLSGRRIRR